MRFRPLYIVYVEKFEDKKSAKGREREIKKWKSHKMIDDLISSAGSPDAIGV